MFKRPSPSMQWFALAAFSTCLLQWLIGEALLGIYVHYDGPQSKVMVILRELPVALAYSLTMASGLSAAFAFGRYCTGQSLSRIASAVSAVLIVFLPFVVTEHFGLVLLSMLALSFSTVALAYALPFLRTDSQASLRRGAAVNLIVLAQGVVAVLFLTIAELFPLHTCLFLNRHDVRELQETIEKVESFRRSAGRLPDPESQEDILAIRLRTAPQTEVLFTESGHALSFTEKGYEVLILSLHGPFVKFSSDGEQWQCH